MTSNVLIIEDEDLQARSIKRSLERSGYDVAIATTGEEGLDIIQRDHPDVLLVDLRLPRMSGIDVLKNLRERQENLQVIMITAHANVETAVEAMRLGAYDYVTKPLDLEELRILLERAIAYSKQAQELAYLREQSRHTPRAELPLGRSPSMQQLAVNLQTFANIERRSGEGSPPVLLLGETGTGKGFAARKLHDLGPRKTQPFIEVNCAALPETLLEAELFGYEKGAFTDARAPKHGLFEAADCGTIFLDEIGHITSDAQAKLLHVIETKTFRRLGAVTVRRVDVRIIAATNIDIEAAVVRGTFRADLFHRLNVLTLKLPPLRERGDDILYLSEQFIQYHCRQYGLPTRGLSREAKERLMLYHWPGNVRELGNEIERALLLESGDELELSQLVRSGVDQKRATIRVENENEVDVELPAEGISFAAVERSVFQQALTMCEGNVAKAARFLRLSRDTLRYRMERLGLRASDAAESC